MPGIRSYNRFNMEHLAPGLKAARLLLAAAAFLVPLVIFPGMEDAFNIPKTTLLYCLGPLSFFLAIYGRERPAFPPVSALFVIMWLIITSLVAENTMLALTDLAWAGTIFLTIAAFLNCGEEWRVFSARLTVIAAAIAAILSLIQYLGHDPLLPVSYLEQTDLKRMYSTFGNKNFLSEYLVLAIPLGWWAFDNKILKTTLTVVMVISILLASSRAAFLAMFAMVIVWAFTEKRKSVRPLYALLATLVLLLFLWPVASRYDHFSSREFTDISTPYKNSLEQRLHIWDIGLQMLRNQPFTGSGPASFRWRWFESQAAVLGSLRRLEYFCRADRAHNEPLQILVEHGIIGLLAILWLFGHTIFALIRKSRQEPHLDGILMFFAAFSVFALLAFPLRIPGSVFLLSLAIAQAWARTGNITLFEPGVLSGKLLPFFSLSAAFIYCFIGVFLSISSWNAGRGILMKDLGYFQASRNYFRQAAIYDVTAGFASYELGRLMQEAGDYTGALKEYQKAARTFSQPVLFENKARVLWSMNRYAEARELAEEAFRLNPGSIRCADLIRRMAAHEGDLAKVREMEVWISVLQKAF